jgi:hypothetical protein
MTQVLLAFPRAVSAMGGRNHAEMIDWVLSSTGFAPLCKPARAGFQISINDGSGFPSTIMLAGELSNSVVHFWLNSIRLVWSSKDAFDKLKK